MVRWFAAVILCLSFASAKAADDGLELTRLLIEGDLEERQLALRRIGEQERLDLVAPMITLMRYMGPFAFELGAVLDELTGEDHGPDWHGWMIWQEQHPEIEPMAEFDHFKADLMARIDENFRDFLYPGVQHEIRLEEVVWGGVRKDGIPALNDPLHIEGRAADYLEPDELVFGVRIEGDARAYPLRIMNWHEMFNDVVGGVPVALAYCTLCGSGILYETGSSPTDRILFGSSGFLYRSNKLMYDRETLSLWNQFTGEPVVGKLSGQVHDLPLRPVVITSWQEWLARNPDTKVLSLDTGFTRDYSPGAAYGEYFSSPDLMFPSAAAFDDRLAAKDYVFVMRDSGLSKSWPVAAFGGGRIVHDKFAGADIVLIGDSSTRTVRAYRGTGAEFKLLGDGRLESDGEVWTVGEDRLRSQAGAVLERMSGHVAYWFASAGFLGERGGELGEFGDDVSSPQP